jgi:hypothetical protein
MPSGPPELWDLFPNGDADALEAIAENYTVGKGFVIRPKVAGHKPSELENAALDHLWLEWDYAFDGC